MYGTFKKGLKSQFYLDNDQYPKTIVAGVDTFNHKKSDIKYYELQKWNRDRSCPEHNEKTSNKFSQKTGKNIIYHCCGKPRHISTRCDLKYSTPNKDWYMHKIMQHHQ